MEGLARPACRPPAFPGGTDRRLRAPAHPDVTLSEYSPRSTLDIFQRLFYAARENANPAAATPVRFVAAMNGETLRQLGREVAMGGVVALLTLPAACEEAAASADGPTGIVLWDVELVLDSSLGDSEIRVDEVQANDRQAGGTGSA